MTENVARLYTAELLSTVEESITAKPRQKGNGIVLRSSIVTRVIPYIANLTLPYCHQLGSTRVSSSLQATHQPPLDNPSHCSCHSLVSQGAVVVESYLIQYMTPTFTFSLWGHCHPLHTVHVPWSSRLKTLPPEYVTQTLPSKNVSTITIEMFHFCSIAKLPEAETLLQRGRLTCL